MARRLTALVVTTVLVCAAASVLAQSRVKQHGRSTVEFRSDDALAIVSYDFAQKSHDGAWLLLDFGIQTKPRVAIHRDQFSLRGPDERTYRLASQRDFLEDQAALNQLKQNALVLRRDISSYFTAPVSGSISFFAWPRAIVQDTFATNLDDVASGDLLFKTVDGKWAPGTYRLVVNHERVKVELPLELK